MSQPSRMVFKVTVLGDGGVGKTALTVQFTMSSFVETYDPTIEDCYRKQWVVDDQPCLLEVLDTAGQEEYTALRDQWIRDGEGFLVVYSIAARSTFDRVEKIVERIMLVKEEARYAEGAMDSSPPGRSHSGGKPGSGSVPGGDGHHRRVPVVIVGNKRDQTNSREVPTEEGRALAQRLGCEFFETSARLNQNVEDSFRALVKLIQRDKRPEPTAQAAPTPRKKHRKCRIL